MTNVAAKAPLRIDIQAMRGVAVLLVVLYHAGLPALGAGYLGVDIFFVISGFLITTLVKRELEAGTFSFHSFYYRRARRLLPAAYIVIAATIILSNFFLTQIEISDLLWQVIGSITFTANIVLWNQSGYFDADASTKALLHFWSLSVEEQYYLILPMFLWFAPRRWWNAGILFTIIASLGLSIFYARAYPSAAFFLLPTRAWELAVGSMGALLAERYAGHRAWAALRIPSLMIVVAIPFFPTNLPHPGFNAALVCLASVVIIMAGDQPHWKRNILVRTLANVGNISYSLYLVHWPVLVFTRAAWLGQPPLWAIWLAVFTSFVLSYFLYRLIEQPLHKGATIGKREMISGLVATSVVLSVIPVMSQATADDGLDFNYIRRINYGYGDECASRVGAFEPTETCMGGAQAPQIIVWGDSLAMHLVAGMADVAAQAGVVQATRSMCGPIVGLSPVSQLNTRYGEEWAGECAVFNESIIKYIEQSSSLKTVVMSTLLTQYIGEGGWGGLVKLGGENKVIDINAELSASAWAATIERIKAAGKQVVIFGPTPMDGNDPSDCLERRFSGKVVLGNNSTCEVNRKTALQRQAAGLRILELVDDITNTKVVSFFDALCARDKCRTSEGNTIIYRDRGHLSYDGSIFLARNMHWAKIVGGASASATNGL